jgi:hypothetical protein
MLDIAVRAAQCSRDARAIALVQGNRPSERAVNDRFGPNPNHAIGFGPIWSLGKRLRPNPIGVDRVWAEMVVDGPQTQALAARTRNVCRWTPSSREVCEK